MLTKMTRVETTAMVAEDRTMTVQLPATVRPGTHAVIVLVDASRSPRDESTDKVESAGNTAALSWENGVLVWTGEVPSDFDSVQQIQDDREERIRQLSYGEPE